MIKTEINRVEDNCRVVLEDLSNRREELDATLIKRLNNSIELIQSEINHILVESGSNDQDDIHDIIENEIPKLQLELMNE